jgi:hypothetical protein
MELSVMERYVAFICSELPKTRRVLLTPPPPMENGELGYKRTIKIGPHVYMETTIEIVETYTRSAKLCVKFEDYQMNDIFYMSRHKGPDKLLEEIDKKIDKIVNRTLIDDGRQEWVREQYKIKSEDFPLFKFGPGVEVDVYGDLYKRYTKTNVVKNDDGSETHISPPGHYNQMTKDEFIEKLKTDDEFNKTWGGMRKNIVE